MRNTGQVQENCTVTDGGQEAILKIFRQENEEIPVLSG